MQAGREFSSSLSTLHLHLLKGTIGVKRSTTNWAVLRECGHEPLQIYWFRSAVKLFNSVLNTNSSDTLRRVVQADLNLQSRSSACWTAQLLSAFQGLRGCELYVRAVQTGRAIPMQKFTADLKHMDERCLETLSWWTPTRTTTNWPRIILGLPPLFLEMSVCQLLYHSIYILICPNMLCAM